MFSNTDRVGYRFLPSPLRHEGHAWRQLLAHARISHIATQHGDVTTLHALHPAIKANKGGLAHAVRTHKPNGASGWQAAKSLRTRATAWSPVAGDWISTACVTAWVA